jgi:hypothetical protein
MLLDSSPNHLPTIHVCAPSNCAVDEILTRIRIRGLVGITEDHEELKQFILRVGAPEYEAPDLIQEYTLEDRCQ